MEPGVYWYDPKKARTCPTKPLRSRRLVYVVRYDWEVGGGVSNWVDFRTINANGKISSKLLGTYNWDQFIPARGYALFVRKVSR